MGRRVAAASTAGVLVLALVGACSQSDPQGAPATTPAASASVSPAVPDLGRVTPAPRGLVNEDTEETIGPRDVPVWDEDSRQAATAAATAAMATFARPDLGYDAWWAQLEPLLAAQAAELYAYVDPANIPAHRVTGAASLIDEASAYVANVAVPTDAGTYTVVLSRPDGASPWLATRFVPPQDGR